MRKVFTSLKCLSFCLGFMLTSQIAVANEVSGCQDPLADNYNNLATKPGFCEYEGCTDSAASNYDDGANVDDDSCSYPGCNDTTAFNYEETANVSDSTCYPVIVGCMDTLADNYTAALGDVQIDINTHDGELCDYYGCLYPSMFNHDAKVTDDDGSCYPVIEGCMDSTAFNYVSPVGDLQSDVNTDDGSCYPIIEGCLDATADNYNDYDENGFSNGLTGDKSVDVNTSTPGACVFYGCVNVGFIQLRFFSQCERQFLLSSH